MNPYGDPAYEEPSALTYPAGSAGGNAYGNPYPAPQSDSDSDGEPGQNNPMMNQGFNSPQQNPMPTTIMQPDPTGAQAALEKSSAMPHSPQGMPPASFNKMQSFNPQSMQMVPQEQQQMRPDQMQVVPGSFQRPGEGVKRAGVSMPSQHVMTGNAGVYDTWFQFADSDRDGRVTGKDAVTFFARSYLPKDHLAKVWDIANSNRVGYLDRPAFHKAMDLISLAQQGQDMTMENYRHMLEAHGGTLPLPRLEGFDEETGMPELSTQMEAVTVNKSEYAPTPAQFQSAADVAAANAKNWKLVKKKGPMDGRAVPNAKVCTSIIDGLKHIYFQKVKPLEEAFKFPHFFTPFMNESDFDAKPSILLMGQYSTGKTTLIKYLLGRDYPGCNIGPEPTTDRFTVVYHGLDERRVPGNTLAVQPDLPYQGLAGFGTGFLTRFEGSQCPSPLLEAITIVDTPGVLSGEKQRIERHYNFVEVGEWFSSRCDLIFLLFDPHKLDISDEFKQVIQALRGHEDKVRIILNKSDQMDQQQLMRVYGALMWSLGKVFKSPEVCRVYIGSFNSEAPISTEKNPAGKPFFESEQADLLQSLYDCPQRSADRKINEFVKRVRACKIHMLLMGHMRTKMPSMWGKDKVQKKMLDDLPETFKQIQREHHLPIGDFPDINRFREILSAFDIGQFPKFTPAMIKQIDDVLTVDIPKLVKQFDTPF